MSSMSADHELPEDSAEDLYENAPCGYLSTTPQGLIAKVNLTLLTWLGYRRDEVLNQKRFIDLLSLPSRAFHETHYAPLLSLQGFANEIALDLVCRDGRTLPILLNSVQKIREDGSVFFTRTTIFNAESRRSYERELLLERRKAQQAAKAKTDFLGSASHEIRNHLHSIAAITELFVAGKTGAQHQRYTGLLSASSGSLLNLVCDVLDYSKLEAGKLALEERPFAVRDLLEGVAVGLRGRAAIKGLTLRVEVDPRVPATVLGDAIKLAQVLTNLAGNAVKFTEHGLVVLSARAREVGPSIVQLAFSVSDTGIGIQPAELALLENPDLTGGLHGEGQARGMGLAISQRLLDLYGARLRASSVPDRGSIFSFELSLPMPAQPASVAPGLPGEALMLRGLRVLVAENIEVDALLLTHLLERWGVEVVLVESGTQAIDQVRRQAFDVVLMDLLLPGLDGVTAARAIRGLDSAAADGLPIIALAPSAQLGQRDRLHGAGFTDCIGKPFEPDTLLRSVSLHASIHRALRQHEGVGLRPQRLSC